MGLSELSRDMEKKTGRPFAEVSEEFLRSWGDRGFEIRFCGTLCSDASGPYSVPAAVQAASEYGEANVLFSRP